MFILEPLVMSSITNLTLINYIIYVLFYIIVLFDLICLFLALMMNSKMLSSYSIICPSCDKACWPPL